MIEGINRIVEALRAEGVVVSTAEGIDAVRAARAIGIESRERLRAALGATLAKGRRSRFLFEGFFDHVFATGRFSGGESGRRGDGGDSGGGAGGRGHGAAGLKDRRLSPSEGTSATIPRGGRPAYTREEVIRPARAAGVPRSSEPPRGFPPTAVRGSREWPGRGTPRPIEPAVRKGRLRRIVITASPGSSRHHAADPGGPGWRVSRGEGRDAARAGIESRTRQTLMTHAAGGDDPMLRALDRRMNPSEERGMAAMVPRIVRQMRSRPSRRSIPSRRGSIRMRSILRENMRYGGIPFVLPVRAKKPRPPRVLLLVDVSWSAARSAGLFLSIALRFLESAETARRSRVFLFVDTPIEATGALRSWVRPVTAVVEPPEGGRPAGRGDRAASGINATPGGGSFASVLAGLAGLNLDAPSDYGRVFFRLARRERPAGRDTVLVVLGDGRVNRFDPLPWAFEEIAGRCRSVIWIVPERRERWATADSALHDYLPHCDVAVEARDLAGLARGVRELLRAM